MGKIFDYGDFINKLNESLKDTPDLLVKIDYTLLKPEATNDDIIELCKKADQLGVKSVCVLPKMVSLAAYELRDSAVLVCTVVSFPHGTDSTQEKITETNQVISDGADEVDMVLNYPLLKEKGDDAYEDLLVDVESLVKICHNHKNKENEPITLKVIVESGLLTDEETEYATEICLEAGADFIKTSTGMVAVGAELDKVQIMKKVIDEAGSNMQIKASGGLRTRADLEKFDRFVDRFGVGYAAVDSIFGENETSTGDGY